MKNMTLATCVQKITDLGFQTILNNEGLVIGVNLVCKNKIFLKKRFEIPRNIRSKEAENEMVNNIILAYFIKK